MRATARNAQACVWAAAALAAGLAGCGRADLNPKFVTQARADRGVVLILPGIEGQSSANRDIREGLASGQIPYALVIYRWGSRVPGPGGMLLNQTDVQGNRQKARDLAQRIVQYQQDQPGRPVFIIGHSAGGGMAVFALEYLAAIPGAKPIEGVFLLSASISSDYDLTPAMTMTRRGLANVYNPDDRILDTGTARFGNVDGRRGPSAGRTGFTRPFARVYQRCLTTRMVAQATGESGLPHFLATHEKLISRYAPPWILSETWPPPGVPAMDNPAQACR